MKIHSHQCIEEISVISSHSCVVYTTNKDEIHMLIYGGELHPYNLFSTKIWDFNLTDLDNISYVCHPLSGPQPPQRSTHTAFEHNNKMIFFGGYGIDGPMQDLWYLDLDTMMWTEVDKRTQSELPPSRYCHAACRAENLMYIFGGTEESDLNDSYVLDLDTFQWKQLMCTGQIPSPRFHHSLCHYNGSLILFGGRNIYRFNDMHLLNLQTLEWTKIDVSGGPSPRSSHSCSLIKNQMIIFGGFDGTTDLSDIHALNLDTMHWQQNTVVDGRRRVDITHPTSPTSPTVSPDGEEQQEKTSTCLLSGRSLHSAAVVHGNYIAIFGGYDGSENMNDLTIIDTGIPTSHIMSDLKRMLSDNTVSDVRLHSGDRSVVGQYHKCILNARLHY